MFQADDTNAHIELKARLVRYYNHYNPSNLEKMDEILEAYDYNADELFDDLLQVYGPEIPVKKETKHVHIAVSNETEESERQVARHLIESAEGRDRVRQDDSEASFRQKLEVMFLEETLSVRAIDEERRRTNAQMDNRKKELEDLRRRLELSNQQQPEIQQQDPPPRQRQISRVPSLTDINDNHATVLERDLIVSAEGRGRLRQVDSEASFRQKLEVMFLEETLSVRANEEERRRANVQMDNRKKELEDLRRRVELSNQPQPELQQQDPPPRQRRVSPVPSLPDINDNPAAEQQVDFIKSAEGRGRLRMVDSEVLFRQRLEMLFLEETLNARANEEEKRRVNAQMNNQMKELDDLRRRLELSNQPQPELQQPNPPPRSRTPVPSPESSFRNNDFVAMVLERDLIVSAEARARLRQANAEALFRQRHEMLFLDESLKAHAIENENHRMCEQLEIRKRELEDLRRKLEHSQHPKPRQQQSQESVYSFASEAHNQYNDVYSRYSEINANTRNNDIIRWAAGQEGQSIPSVPFGRNSNQEVSITVTEDVTDRTIVSLGSPKERLSNVLPYHPRAGGRYSSTNPGTSQFFKDFDDPSRSSLEFGTYTPTNDGPVLEISVNCSQNRSNMHEDPSPSITLRTQQLQGMREYTIDVSNSSYSATNNQVALGRDASINRLSTPSHIPIAIKYKEDGIERASESYGDILSDKSTMRIEDRCPSAYSYNAAPSIGRGRSASSRLEANTMITPIKVSVTTNKYIVDDGACSGLPLQDVKEPSTIPNKNYNSGYVEYPSHQMLPITETGRLKSEPRNSDAIETRSYSGMYVTPEDSKQYNYPNTSFQPIAQFDPKTSIFVPVNKNGTIYTNSKRFQSDGSSLTDPSSGRRTNDTLMGLIDSRAPSSSINGIMQEGYKRSMSGSLKYCYTSGVNDRNIRHTPSQLRSYYTASHQPTEKPLRSTESLCTSSPSISAVPSSSTASGTVTGNRNIQSFYSVDLDPSLHRRGSMYGANSNSQEVKQKQE